MGNWTSDHVRGRLGGGYTRSQEDGSFELWLPGVPGIWSLAARSRRGVTSFGPLSGNTYVIVKDKPVRDLKVVTD